MSGNQQNQEGYNTMKKDDQTDPNPKITFFQHDGDGDTNRTNLIVNYLPQTMTNKELYNMFSKYGSLENVWIMRDVMTGYSYGYGFVKFVTSANALQAMHALNMTEYCNKRLKVSYARPSGNDNKFTNLYITNLPNDYNEDKVEKLFNVYGDIIKFNILKNKLTGKPRGVAFVRYSKGEEAWAAIKNLHGKLLEGCAVPISVRIAEEYGKHKATFIEGWNAGFQMHTGFRPQPRGGFMPGRGMPPFNRGAFRGPTGRGNRFNQISGGEGCKNMNHSQL